MTVLVRPIVVTGLMGSGKTSVARALAALLACPLHDSDTDIERTTGRTAREIKETDGREALHDAEGAHLVGALRSKPYGVIAAAASIVDRTELRTALVDAAAFVIWLDVEPAVLESRFSAGEHRPQYESSVRAMFEKQLAKRRANFEAVADLVLADKDASAAELAGAIVRALPLDAVAQ